MRIWSRKDIQELLNRAAAWGMQQERVCFPLDLQVLFKEGDLSAEVETEVVESGQATGVEAFERVFSLPYPDMALESLFRPGLFLSDRNADGLPDDLQIYFCLPENPDDSVVGALADLTCRLAMDCTELDSSQLLEAQPGKIPWRLSACGQAELCWRAETRELWLNGQGEELRRFVATLCNDFDHVEQPMSPEELSWQLRRAVSGCSYDGQKAFAHWRGQDWQYVLDLPAAGDPEFEEAFQVQRRQSPKLAWQIERADYSEVEQAEELIKALTATSRAEILAVQAVLSKPLACRQALAADWQKRFPEAKIEVLNAYKPGFSWLEERCLPQLKKLRPERLLIRFRPFQLDPSRPWDDEDGAVPRRGAAAVPQRSGQWLELPIRFLQELYPIDDLLAAELKLERSAIEFTAAPELASTYDVQAFCGGELVFRDSYEVHCSERFYLDAFPEAGLVHPTSSYLEIRLADGSSRCWQFPTDRDWLWTCFQEQMLSRVGAELAQRFPQGVRPEQQPFFARLRLDFSLEETDRHLPCRQDLLAPLDALQEDLYFTALDYFKYYGQAHGDALLSAPGLIWPELHLKQGPPRFLAAWEDALAERAEARDTQGRRYDLDLSCGRMPLSLSRLSLSREGELCYHYTSRGLEQSYLECLSGLLHQGKLSLSMNLPRRAAVCLGEATPCRRPETSSAPLDIREIDLPDDELIDDQRLEKIMADLRRVPGVEVLHWTDSYGGRPVYALRLVPRTGPMSEDGYRSRCKLLSRRPSVILNCRHHANEISSTNSSLLLLRWLLSEPEGQELAIRFHLVIVPMENPDGAAVHAALAAEHPTYKLHVARFNALGYEFAYDNFKLESLHSEAHAAYALYREYLPDLYLDDHGVPSHEWEQTFSGYTSPAFKGFWLPRAILYGYFWCPQDPAYASGLELCRAIEEAVCEAINADPEMAASNAEWQERFEKYAHAYLPRLFPADYKAGMIHYWIWKEPRAENLYVSQRWPWISSCYYTSEVADETATGPYLALCTRTHFYENLAVLRLISGMKSAYNVKNIQKAAGLKTVFERKRPILPDGGTKV